MQREYLHDRPGIEGSAGSTWLAEGERPMAPPLTGTYSADVAVVGGGIFGVLTAVRLARMGASVALVEGRRVGSLVSGHTSAKVTAQHNLVSGEISSQYREAWLQANVAAVERLEGWARIAGEKAAFTRVDSCVYTERDSAIYQLVREAELYSAANLRGGMVDAHATPAGMTAAVCLSDQAIFDPVGLIDCLIDTAGPQLRVFEGSLVNRVAEEEGGVVIATPAGVVRAENAVVASHVPFFDTLLYMTRLFQERTYVLEVEVPEGVVVPPGTWFREDREISWRPAAPGERHRLVVSGQSHMAGEHVDERRYYARLAELTRQRFGSGTKVLRHWSTQDAHSLDGLPYVGKMHGRERTFMASGFGGWGMTTSEVAAEVVTGLIDGTADPELVEMLSPLRVRATGLVRLAVENAEVVAKAFTSELDETGDPESVAPGEGRTMRSEYGHVAVARDEGGKLHVRDSHCTHMRCTVEFNDAEGTWDCPCHGSRYLADGRWLHGPSRRPLETPHHDLSDQPGENPVR